MIYHLWHAHRRVVATAAIMLVALVAVLGLMSAAVRLVGHRPTPNVAGAAAGAHPAATTPNARAAPTDVAGWDARPLVAPSTSPAFPAITAGVASDPTTYARAFAAELFTRDYSRSTRGQLISWAQSEESPLRVPQFSAADRSKVLVDSLTDLSWEDAADTPIPSAGEWLMLQVLRAQQSVTDITVGPDPRWDRLIADGYVAPDPKAVERDVVLTVTLRTVAAGRVSVSRFSVTVSLQLGSSLRRDGYAVAASNGYLMKPEY